MSEMTTREDAREFGLHITHGGWRLGLLVARSVEKGTPAHRPVTTVTGAKVSARQFAEDSGTSANRVLRYLAAWDKAAAAGWVPRAETLTPGQEVGLPDALKWSKFYDATDAGGRPRDSKPQDAVTIIERRGVPNVVAAMSDSMQREMFVFLTQMFELERDKRLREDAGAPIRSGEERLEAGRLVMAVAQIDRRVRDAVKFANSGEVGIIDQDDKDRLHVFITRIREALDLLDMLAGGGVDDAALEAWLSGGAA